ncbi:DNA ligase 4 isoform X1 [Megachile rotundata]|uniref:DNA ligase 4 isoform X1 n=1 Tax=Megachile rotundata TaxID=143995 RepID=UPI000258DCB5|nr:PREDICTED: DNA ligase 4 [Megachile rotundata]
MTLATKIEFKKLCNVLEEIEEASSARKVDLLEKFIQQCRLISYKLKAESPDMDVSLYPIMRLILPHLERERRPHNLKEKSLAALYIRVFCLGKNSRDAKELTQYKAPGRKRSAGRDFAGRAYYILKKHLPCDSSNFKIEQINKFLDDISVQNGTKDQVFKILLKQINALEFKWITRIIVKDLKLGMGTTKILQVFHPDANGLFEVSSNLRKVCDTLYDPHLRYDHSIQVFSHFKPMLLERYKIEDVEKLFASNKEYFVQNKYDGERSQMHMKDGKYKYFTRQGFDITNNSSYGKDSSSGFMSSVFGRLLNPQCKSIILDGELMGWHKEKKLFGSKGMSFDVKKLSENSHHQPCFVAFDIIMYNDTLLDKEPYSKRLEILKDAFKEEEGCLILCKFNKISNSEELRKVFNESIRNKEEGIVLKECNNKYKPNVRDGSGCYKIKAEFSDDLVQDVDLIILGGYYGEGRCIGLMKSFLMGVASPSAVPGENPSEFFAVVSVSSGLIMEALKDIWEMFKEKWQTTCPANVIPPKRELPDKWIRPEDSIILTIRASEMTVSNDYPTGYSLRFPRVMQVRTDKPWYSVCTTKELLSLIKDTRPIQKLTKREVDHEDTEESPKVKVRKSTQYLPQKLEAKFTKMETCEDTSTACLTRLFDDREICVINGNDELPKERIEKILSQHKAKVVQSPSKNNYCIIVGNAKTARAANIIESKKYDVVTLDWFKRVTKEENWPCLQDFLPWDLIACRESTKQRLMLYYDDYYDSFTIDANEESLLSSFKKIEEEGTAQELDCAQMKEIDKELFDNGVSPYSIFRGIVAYFDDPLNGLKVEFRFMAGTIKETLDDSVTHVFVSKGSVSPELQSLIKDKSRESLTVVKSEWIEKCFEQGDIISTTAYLI